MATENPAIPLPPTEPPVAEIAEAIGEGITLPPATLAPPPEAAAEATPTPTTIDHTIFNPAYHVSPTSKNMDGTFRRKKGAPKGPQQNGSTKTVSQPDASAANCGIVVAGLFVGLGCALCGRDFAPETPDEMATLAKPVDELMAKYGVSNIPPEMAVILAFSGYAMAKFAGKETVRKTFAEKVIEPFKKWRAKRKG